MGTTATMTITEAQSVLFLLRDFLAEADQTTATEAVMFLRDLIAKYEAPNATPTTNPTAEDAPVEGDGSIWDEINWVQTIWMAILVVLVVVGFRIIRYCQLLLCWWRLRRKMPDSAVQG